jgi:hypothetical protein
MIERPGETHLFVVSAGLVNDHYPGRRLEKVLSLSGDKRGVCCAATDALQMVPERVRKISFIDVV